MRVKRFTFQVTSVFWISLAACAQSPEAKVGVVNVQSAVVGTKEGQKASQELEAKFQPRQKDFERREGELSQLQDQLNKSGSVLSEEKRTQLTREFDAKKKKLDRDMSDARDDLAAEQQRLLQSIGQKLLAEVEKYAKEKGFSLVLEVSNPNTSVLFSAPSIDLTQDIITQYDHDNPPR